MNLHQPTVSFLIAIGSTCADDDELTVLMDQVAATLGHMLGYQSEGGVEHFCERLHAGALAGQADREAHQ